MKIIIQLCFLIFLSSFVLGVGSLQPGTELSAVRAICSIKDLNECTDRNVTVGEANARCAVIDQKCTINPEDEERYKAFFEPKLQAYRMASIIQTFFNFFFLPLLLLIFLAIVFLKNKELGTVKNIYKLKLVILLIALMGAAFAIVALSLIPNPFFWPLLLIPYLLSVLFQPLLSVLAYFKATKQQSLQSMAIKFIVFEVFSLLWISLSILAPLSS